MGRPQDEVTSRTPSSQRECAPPPPASWPTANHTPCARSSGAAKTALLPRVPPTRREGFGEQIEVFVPGREAKFLVRVAGRELAATNGVAVVLHGGGFTGMSWAPVAGVMKLDCCVVAPDLRGHGLTSSASSSSSSTGVENDDLMSLESLAEDVVSLLVEMFTTGVLLRPAEAAQDQAKQDREMSRPSDSINSSGVFVCGGGGTTVVKTVGADSSQQRDGGFAKGGDRGGDGLALPWLGSSGTDKGPTTAAAASAARDRNDGDYEIGQNSRAVEVSTTSNPRVPLAASGESSVVDSGGNSGVAREEAVLEASRPARASTTTTTTTTPSDPGNGCTISVLLVGHSLGGSIAVRVARAAEDFKRRCSGSAEILGIVAVDVVEGTALAALDDMPEVLRKIPKSFPSMEEAVLWHVKTGAVRNSVSASIVVPSRLKEEGGRVVWRTDLRSTEKHWRGWFEGMSEAFLALPLPKLLIVAGMDRLDTDLTAAHMQGKFQLKLVYGCGHSVQEDQPEETASSILKFAIRHSVIRQVQGGGSTSGIREAEEEELRRKLARARGHG